jgi:shikimate dehydrogenase
MERYGVIGNPIAHSRSPEIHQAFADQFDRSIDFTRILATVEDFDEIVAEFVKSGGKGLSVTMPFKQQAFELSHTVSDRALDAKAVNTLIIDSDGKVSGDNTDGPGLVTDMQVNLDWQIKDKTILLLGAGGAARGILQSLCQELPECLVIANRTESKAHWLASQYEGAVNVAGSSINQLAKSFELIINATGASLQGSDLEIPEIVVTTHSQCYDLTYAAHETPFIRWARLNGAAHTADGLGMLVEQAAVAFQLWLNQRPNTKPVIEKIRIQMTNG